jgi:hypothetical protein
MSKQVTTKPDALLAKVVGAAQSAGCTAELIPYPEGWKRGCYFLRNRLFINRELYALYALYNTNTQRSRRVEYARGLFRKSTIEEVTGNIVCVASPHGFARLVVPSEDVRRFFSNGQETWNFRIERNGRPGIVFDFWKYQDAWPRPVPIIQSRAA